MPKDTEALVDEAPTYQDSVDAVLAGFDRPSSAVVEAWKVRGCKPALHAPQRPCRWTQV